MAPSRLHNSSGCSTGVGFNFFAGGMLFESQQFGLTGASVESYFAGGGITWRFNRGTG